MSTPTPYSGSEPFIFLSFSEKDSTAVLRLISKMQVDGYRIWYDDGTSLEENYSKTVADKISSCEFFIAIFTSSFISTDACISQLDMAQKERKSGTAIFLEELTLSLGMRFRLLQFDGFHKYAYTNENDFWDELYESDNFGLFNLSDAPKRPTPETSSPNKDFLIENGVLSAYSGDDEYVVIPEGVHKIDRMAFAFNNSIKTVFVPSSITFIDEMAFYQCTSLVEVFLPDTINHIGEKAFAGCTSFARFFAPEKVKKILPGTFWGCTALVRVIISNSVTEIGAQAFKLCENLNEVVIGSGLTSLAADAFDDCKRPLTIRYKGTREAWYKIIEALGWKKGEGKYIVHYNQKG